MKYLDCDALIAQMRAFQCGEEEYDDGIECAINVCAIADAADVRPVVRGRWISDGDGYHWVYVCSVCGWKDGYPFNERHNFCPNCGADMREDKR